MMWRLLTVRLLCELGPHFSNRKELCHLKIDLIDLIDYFTEDGDEYDVQEAPAQAVGASQPVASPKPVQPSSKPRQKAVVAAKEQKPTPVAASRPQVASTAVVESASSQKSSSENITRLHQRQQELAKNRSAADEKITIECTLPS